MNELVCIITGTNSLTGIAPHKPMATETQKKFLETMRINTWSVYAAIKYASEAMQKTSERKSQGGGSIIATASVAGIRSGAGPVTYSASKAAVINLCQSAAWRLRGKNIRVDAICPGLIQTEMTQNVLKAIQGNDVFENALNRASALERFGHPEEIAAMVAFLASNKALFITGQDIRVDGGMTASIPYAPFFAEE